MYGINICGGNINLSHNKLYRNFIILQEDERGYSSENGKALSGYAKVEAKGDKCKISFYAQIIILWYLFAAKETLKS